jgi:hypothetical protein
MQALPGYLLDEKEYDFDIDANTKIVKFEFTNEKGVTVKVQEEEIPLIEKDTPIDVIENDIPRIPKTGKEAGSPLGLLLLMALSARAAQRRLKF